MMVIYVPVKFEFDWTNRFSVRVWTDKMDGQKNGQKMDKWTEKWTNKLANLISKLNFYKLIPYPMDNILNRSAQTGPPNARKRRPVFPPAGRSVVLCTPQMAPRTSFLSRQPDVIASFSLSKPLRPLVS